MALAVMLLAGAGLLMRSFLRLQSVDPGFNPAHTLSFELSLPDSRYKENPPRVTFFDQLLPRLRALPGVRTADAVMALPLSGTNFNISFSIAGRPPVPPAQEPAMEVRVATPGYFNAIGIPLKRGRWFTEDDRDGTPRVVLLTESAAHRVHERRDEDDDAPGIAGERRAAGGPCRRSGSARVEHRVARDHHRGVDLAAPVLHAAPRHLRVGGARPRGDRDFRRALVHRIASHARDRDPDGARRAGPKRRDPDRPPGDGPRGVGRRRRDNRGAAGVAGDDEDALQREADRTRHLRQRRRRARVRDALGELSARAQGHARRSHRGAPRGIGFGLWALGFGGFRLWGLWVLRLWVGGMVLAGPFPMSRDHTKLRA